MDPRPTAPPVVAVVVVSDPGAWLEEALSALGAQDYPELSVLVLDAASPTDPAIGRILPSAHYRRLPDPVRWEPAANEVLSMVVGAAYLVFVHQDAALDDDAVRQLVEEALASNAGIVGPKIVEWERPERLLEVGLAVDKTGAAVSLVEPGELDQEQHDGVRDVFAVPATCFLVRADLFHALGGFDTELAEGAAVDLCWRAQVAGARVLVAPAARVRHLGADGPRPPLADAARSRIRTVLKNYGWAHRLRVLPQAALVTLVEALIALFGRRWSDARALVGAWPSALREGRRLGPSRRSLRAMRLVPDSEVRRLQTRGSAHLVAYLRGRHAEDRVEAVAESLRTERGRVAALAWVTLVVVLLVGSRHLIGGRVPAVGELAPFPSAGTFLRHVAGGWRTTGLGSEAAAPPAFAVLGLGGLVLGGAVGLLRKLLILAVWPVGLWGASRLARPFGSGRPRLVAVIVYAAVPVPYDALARGRLTGLVAYAVAPWLLLRLARATRIAPFDDGPSTTIVELAGMAALVAAAAAFAPLLVLVTLLVAVASMVGSVIAGRVAASLRGIGIAVAGAAGAALLLFPWSADFALPGRQWAALAGARPPIARAFSFADLLRFHTGPVGGGLFGWAFLVAAAFPLVLGREWRLAWAVRLWVVALVCVGAAWALGRGWIPGGVTSPEVILAPAAAALAGAVALGVAAFDLDLPGYRFGWRQVATVVAGGAVIAGTLPLVVAASDGRWRAPNGDLAGATSWMPTEAVAHGSFRVLWLGDPTVLPLGSWPVGPRGEGLAFGTSRDGPPDATDLWPGAASGATALIADALATARRGDTSSLGHLLAPMAIRYIVVVQRDAPAQYHQPLRPAPPTVLHALADQVDLQVRPADPAIVVYENRAWAAVRALLPGASSAPAVAPHGADLHAARAALPGDGPTSFGGTLPAGGGELLVAEASSRWHLTVNGHGVARQRSFGWANAFASPVAGGRAHLRFRTPLAHDGALALEVFLWILVLRVLRRERRRRKAERLPAPEVGG
ncbi:MAG: putative glycosyltransferase [Acidimicrobiales bacterium]|nr:putative glycosyltransferase [Acidimicrobiales bacterium]